MEKKRVARAPNQGPRDPGHPESARKKSKGDINGTGAPPGRQQEQGEAAEEDADEGGEEGGEEGAEEGGEEVTPPASLQPEGQALPLGKKSRSTCTYCWDKGNNTRTCPWRAAGHPPKPTPNTKHRRRKVRLSWKVAHEAATALNEESIQQGAAFEEGAHSASLTSSSYEVEGGEGEEDEDAAEGGQALGGDQGGPSAGQSADGRGGSEAQGTAPLQGQGVAQGGVGQGGAIERAAPQGDATWGGAALGVAARGRAAL